MDTNEKYMSRCLDLGKLGAGYVSPNPMVGSVIVYRGKIIGEGFHKIYGGHHAEVNAINSVKNQQLLKESILYVNLEPCVHHGKTPPCSDIIIEKRIPKVVIGTIDPFTAVAGKGIEKMRRSGIEVTTGVLTADCLELNKRFFTSHTKKRPYIILKWAQTNDCFIDLKRGQKNYGEPVWITGDTSLRLVHKIRSTEDAILVGTNTAEKDNPSLTVRHWSGRNPLRVVIDKNLRLPNTLNLFKPASKTLVINSKKNSEEESVSFVKIDFEKDIPKEILTELFNRQILSLIVEGGKQILESFILKDLWDEAHVFTGDKFFFEGITAPRLKGNLAGEEIFDKDRLKILRNHSQYLTILNNGPH
jgi:diaminohydroxyphosphoribosylaminopyrimidine deaminase / 5-amino-6-(5-phosphoribosylamino)uracil reductase